MGPQDVRVVVDQYPPDFQPTRSEPLGAGGGFSGSELWRLTTPAGTLALKCWPIGYPVDRLVTVHRVLQHVRQQGLAIVPAPLATRHHQTVVDQGGHLWDLCPWMPGRADYHQQPGPARLVAAMHALAGFHNAAATYPGNTPRGRSAGLAERRQLLARLLSGGEREVREALGAVDWPEARRLAHGLLAGFNATAPACLALLDRVEHVETALQFCLRDIWHDHVLYSDDRVTGVIDFGALRVDSVATDVARLLGSLVRDDEAGWELGLAAYHDIRPLNRDERILVAAFDRSSVVLTGMNWLVWIFVERRQLADRGAVLARMGETLGRLEHLTEEEDKARYGSLEV